MFKCGGGDSEEVVNQRAALKELALVPWHAIDAEEVFRRLSCDATGLSSEAAALRKQKYGPNATTEKSRPGILSRIWDQVNNILIYILLASTIIKAVFGSWVDFGLILGVVVLNVAIGVIQEGKAEEAAAALTSMLAAKAVVLRDGVQQTIDAEDVVIGDVVNMAAGDAIPADVRLFRIANLKVRESALTGESEDVAKTMALCDEHAGIGDQKNRAFAGTFATSGQGMGVVVAIGATAQIGTIKTMLDEAEAGETPLQRQLDVFGTWLSIITLIVAVGAFFLAFYGRAEDLPATNSPLAQSFAVAVSIAVAIIPEGLPSVVTITLALGVRTMATHNAIIRQLPAVETLGSVSVVCSDKTGTLTLNQMMVTSIRTASAAYRVTGQGYDPGSGDVMDAAQPQPLRATDADKVSHLLWLTLPGIVANEGGLMAPANAAGTEVVSTPTRAGERKNSSASPAPLEHVQVQVAGSAPQEAAVAAPAEAAAGDSLWKPAGDPTDVALLVLAHKLGVTGRIDAFKSQYNVLSAVPFDSTYKFQAVLTDVEAPITGTRHRVVYVKGAWDEIIRRCATQATDDAIFSTSGGAPCDQAFWTREASNYAANGMRVLAIAQMIVPDTKLAVTVEQLRDDAVTTPSLQMNCLVAILDPCRESAARAIAQCHGAGMQVKMITGDHADTACYIARELGIMDAATFTKYMAVKDVDPEARRRIVLRGEDIKAIPSDPKESQLAKYVLDVNVYARVAPEHKLRIVRALKETHGRITSMTGDGVNDAPALKEAHVGVAMGITGTDVAKQAAKMILADDSFATIAEAVRRGRGVYNNLQKVVLFSLPTNMAQGVCVLAALIIGWDAPLTAIQVLTVNMVTSVTLGIVLALEEPEADVMTRPPRDPRASLLSRKIAWRTFIVTIILCIGVLGTMKWELAYEGDKAVGRSVAMTTLVIAQGFYALNCRFQHSALTWSVFKGNSWLQIAFASNIVIQLILIYVPVLNTAWGMAPMGGVQWGMALLLSIGAFFAVELLKVVEPTLEVVCMPCVDAIEAAFGRCACWAQQAVAEGEGKATVTPVGDSKPLAVTSSSGSTKAAPTAVAAPAV